jgi:hypothetical protein
MIIDILLIILIVIILLGAIILSAMAFLEGEISTGFGAIFIGLFLAGIVSVPFIALDKKSGMTIGTITSVDKNFFGETTSVYIKTTENSEEKYCVEDEKVIEEAKKNIGKLVKITYGQRVGFYSITKCHDAPIDSIEFMENIGYN